MRSLFLTSFLLTQAYLLSAHGDTTKTTQNYRNTITFTMSDFGIVGLAKAHLNNRYADPILVLYNLTNQFGIQVERSYQDKFVLGLSYNAWNTNPLLNKYQRMGSSQIEVHDFDRRYPYGEKDYNRIGAQRFRHGYKMIDAVASYRYRFLPRHIVTGGVGASFTFGTNLYVTGKYYYGSRPEDFLWRTNRVAESYMGFTVPLRYDFLMLHNRVAIGVQGNARKYFGLYSWLIDGGVHVSYNF